MNTEPSSQTTLHKVENGTVTFTSILWTNNILNVNGNVQTDMSNKKTCTVIHRTTIKTCKLIHTTKHYKHNKDYYSQTGNDTDKYHQTIKQTRTRENIISKAKTDTSESIDGDNNTIMNSLATERRNNEKVAEL